MLKSLVKKLFMVMFLAILIGMFIPQSCFFIKASPEPGSLPPDRPVVFIDPPIVTAGIGEEFTINVKVFNLTDNWIIIDPIRRTKHWLGNLYGLELKISWDPTILNYTSHVVKIPCEVYPDGVLHGDPNDPELGMMWIKNDVNVTTGTYELAVSSMLNPEPFNNPSQSNVIFNMTFKVIGYGSSYITLDSTELAALYDPNNPGMEIIYHHPKWPYPDFVSDTYHEYPGAPIAKFTMFPADAAVVNKPVRFDATESETSDESLVITTYMWDFGDGTILNSTEPIVEHNFTHTGTFTIELMVVDNSTIPLRSAPFRQTLRVVSVREVVVKSYSVSDEVLLLGASLNVTVVVKNEGLWDESFVLAAYYNKTMLEWVEVSNVTVNLRSGDELSVMMIWDTSLVGPYDEGYYALMVNITTVIPHEGNVTNNFAPRPPTEIPAIVVFLTSEQVYDMAVENLRIITVGKEGREFSSPFLVKESLVISASVVRKGTYYETFNATIDIIHFNGTVLVSKAWLLQELGAGNRSVVLTYTFSTANLTTGYYNVSVHVVNSNVTNAELDVNKTNNVVNMLIKIVEPPVLKISKPDTVYVNDTVTLSAADSTHAGGNITKYVWTVYEGIARRADLSGNSSDPYWTVSFDKSGRWKVSLVVEDDNGITYDANRPVSAAYVLEVNVDVSEKQVGAWLPMELILAFILVVVIIVGSVVYLKWRKGGGKSSS